MSRYEIRVYKNAKKESRKDKGKHMGTFYGVWDNEVNNWIVNAVGIGKKKAEKVVAALMKNTNVNKPNLFWKE